MTDHSTVPLSELHDRRAFLACVSALTLAIPGVGAALTACSPPEPPSRTDTTHGAPQSGATGAAAQGTNQPHNSDSRLDSAVLKGGPHGNTSATGTATQSAQSTAYHRFAPDLPTLAPGGLLQLHWHAREVPVRISDDTVVAAWTFEGDVPGPIVHTRVGDTVEFTLTNDALIPHSMDFHAAQINPKAAFRSVAKGESITFTFRPRYAGAFMYHCGT